MSINSKIVICLVMCLVLFFTVSTVFAIEEVKLPNLGPKDFPTFVKNLVAQANKYVADISVIMFTIAGILYLTSGGSAKRMALAKTCLIYTIIGIAFLAVAGLVADAIASLM